MIQEQIDLLLELALCELVEIVAPLAYIFVFIAASYGPNNLVFGNIGNSYWAYKAIEDSSQAVKNMLFLFVVDLSSVVVTVVVLWFSCKINLLNAFYQLQKEFGKRYTLIIGYLILAVSFKVTLFKK